MWRYIRAFFKALAMTIRGETPTTPAQRQYPRLFEWIERAQAALDAVFETTEHAAFDETARKAASVDIDGRDTPVETLLRTIQYHLEEEYPYMLRHLTEHSLTGVYASNVNDTYWARAMSETDAVPGPVRGAIGELADVLGAIPPSNELGPRNTDAQTKH